MNYTLNQSCLELFWSDASSFLLFLLIPTPSTLQTWPTLPWISSSFLWLFALFPLVLGAFQAEFIFSPRYCRLQFRRRFLETLRRTFGLRMDLEMEQQQRLRWRSLENLGSGSNRDRLEVKVLLGYKNLYYFRWYAPQISLHYQ